MKVSVLIGSYNHGNFIRECIESVLKQTYQNFEIIIVDDGSTDHTWDEIQKIKDPRILAEALPSNMGACYSGLKTYEKATGDYICILSSDDRWKPDKLEKQVKFLDDNPDCSAVFGFADYIDGHSRSLYRAKDDIFIQKNRTPPEWYRRFFFEGNCLCHPSIMIRRSCYKELGYYDNRFRQLPDFKMWIHFIKKYKFSIIQESLIDFRHHGAGANTSAPSPVNTNRTFNEIYFLAEEFFLDCPLELFYKAFEHDLKRPDKKTLEHMKIEQAFLFLNCSTWVKKMYRLFGQISLHKLMSEERYKKILEADYNFNINDYYKISGDINTFFNIEQAGDRVVVVEAFKRLKKLTFKRVIRYFINQIKWAM